jgi:hypothetical protein
MGLGKDQGPKLLRDPREEELWFQRLPAAHRARFRRDWEAERLDWALLVLQERRAFQRCVLQATGLFALAHLLTGIGGLQQLLIVTTAGAGVGVLWWKLHADERMAPLLAIPLFCGLEALAVLARMGPSLDTGFVFARFALIAFGLGAVSGWLARERQEA